MLNRNWFSFYVNFASYVINRNISVDADQSLEYHRSFRTFRIRLISQLTVLCLPIKAFQTALYYHDDRYFDGEYQNDYRHSFVPIFHLVLIPIIIHCVLIDKCYITKYWYCLLYYEYKINYYSITKWKVHKDD